MQALFEHLSNTFFAAPTLSTIGAYLTYYIYICLASIFLPSNSVKGHPQPKRGPQLTYSINGFRLTVLTIVLVAFFGGVIPQLEVVRLFSVARLAK